MTRTAATLTSVTFYVALEATQQIYTYEITAADFLDNAQIQQADNNMFYTSIGKDYRKIYLINNFQVGDKLFGSPIGIMFKYQNGEEEWIKKVDAQSSNAKNLNTMIGNWMKDKDFATWKTHLSYKGHPYIGKAENSIIVYMDFIPDPNVEPPIVEPDPDPKPPVKPVDPKPPTNPDDNIDESEDPPPNFTFTPSENVVVDPMLANKMLRNARFRGPRESYKHLMDTDEFIYDIHILSNAMTELENVQKIFIRSLFGDNSDIILETVKRKPTIFENSMALFQTPSIDFIATEEAFNRINQIKERMDTVEGFINDYE